MSSYVDREWFYFLRGREILLYKLLGGSTSERITQAGVFKTQQNELIYPDEDIADGLRIEYTALNEPFVKESLETSNAYTSGTSIVFQDASTDFYEGDSDTNFTASSKTITFPSSSGEPTRINATNNFYVGQVIRIAGCSNGVNNGAKTVASVPSSITITVSESLGDETGASALINSTTGAILGGTAGTNTFTDFAANDKIRVQGTANNDTDYTISSISSNGDALIVSSVPSANESGQRVSITQISVEDSSPSETSHANLNKMLSLALVDYIKAMKADEAGDLERKEYYMKEFWGKLGDNESNKRNISMTFPNGPFAIR